MYRIRLYIVPEQDEDDAQEDFDAGFVDKDLLSSNSGYWWDTVKGDGRVTVTHRANKAKVRVSFGESQQEKHHETGRCREQRNNRANKKNKCIYTYAGYELDDRAVGVFSSPRRPDRLSGALPSSYPMGTGVKRPGREGDHSSTTAKVKKNVFLYIHSPIRLHGTVCSQAQGQLCIDSKGFR
ncbi:hypothetical protein B7P43_G02656 [Cryptotermes secundus]|uniref:Uncharacterized protein n=1 Tax=Cryptotermes secundus TaxID=105785 RepID=A0A2J7QCF1_9NEOP|nr:hypothetical protein B7P43_G02656 [Cryptotermes secundus]